MQIFIDSLSIHHRQYIYIIDITFLFQKIHVLMTLHFLYYYRCPFVIVTMKGEKPLKRMK